MTAGTPPTIGTATGTGTIVLEPTTSSQLLVPNAAASATNPSTLFYVTTQDTTSGTADTDNITVFQVTASGLGAASKDVQAAPR